MERINVCLLDHVDELEGQLRTTRRQNGELRDEVSRLREALTEEVAVVESYRAQVARREGV